MRDQGVVPMSAGRAEPATLYACRRYLIHHRHEPDECGVVFASFQGHESPLRHRATLASCASAGTRSGGTVEAMNERDALAMLPPYVAQRTTVIESGRWHHSTRSPTARRGDPRRPGGRRARPDAVRLAERPARAARPADRRGRRARRGRGDRAAARRSRRARSTSTATRRGRGPRGDRGPRRLRRVRGHAAAPRCSPPRRPARGRAAAHPRRGRERPRRSRTWSTGRPQATALASSVLPLVLAGILTGVAGRARWCGGAAPRRAVVAGSVLTGCPRADRAELARRRRGRLGRPTARCSA